MEVVGCPWMNKAEMVWGKACTEAESDTGVGSGRLGRTVDWTTVNRAYKAGEDTAA